MTTMHAQQPGVPPTLPPIPQPPAALRQQDRSAATVGQQQAVDHVRKGDTVIWMRGGQQKYSDGVVAIVSNVYIGGEGVDLLVPSGTGILESRNLVRHVSERENVPDSRLKDSGLWMNVQEHHSLLLSDKAERDRKKAEQLARQRSQSGQGFRELGPVG